MFPTQNRRARRIERARLIRFRRNGDGGLDTALVKAGASLAGHQHESLFRKALGDAYRNPAAMCCIVCARLFEAARPFGAFLLSAAAIRPTAASVSAICSECWRDASADKIEHHAERVLRRFLPDGRFLDGLQNETAASRHDAAAEGAFLKDNASGDADAAHKQPGGSFVRTST